MKNALCFIMGYFGCHGTYATLFWSMHFFFKVHTVQITFIFIDFRVLNVFYFQTDFNLRFIKRKRDVRLTCNAFVMHLTSHITHSNGYAPYIAYYRSNGFDQRFRKLKPKPKLNPPNAHRSQIKICEKRQTQNVQFRVMPNAFRILKPIQKSSKQRVWVFRNTGANAFAKNQMRLAYEDKRDCTVV